MILLRYGRGRPVALLVSIVVVAAFGRQQIHASRAGIVPGQRGSGRHGQRFLGRSSAFADTGRAIIFELVHHGDCLFLFVCMRIGFVLVWSGRTWYVMLCYGRVEWSKVGVVVWK